MKSKIVKVFVCTLCLIMVISVSGCNSNTAKKPSDNNITGTNQTNTTDSDKRMMADRISKLATSVTGVKNAYVIIADAETTGTANDALGPNNAANPATNNTNTTNNNMTSTNTTSTTNPTTNPTTTPIRNTSQYVALIGIEVEAADATKKQEMVNQVRDKVKDAETSLADVLVTTDPTMIKRIQDMAAGILNGTAVGMTTQINEIRDDLRAVGNDLATGTRDAVQGVTNAVKDATGVNR